jgi:hypothetical protein
LLSGFLRVQCPASLGFRKLTTLAAGMFAISYLSLAFRHFFPEASTAPSAVGAPKQKRAQP